MLPAVIIGVTCICVSCPRQGTFYVKTYLSSFLHGWQEFPAPCITQLKGCYIVPNMLCVFQGTAPAQQASWNATVNGTALAAY